MNIKNKLVWTKHDYSFNKTTVWIAVLNDGTKVYITRWSHAWTRDWSRKDTYKIIRFRIDHHVDDKVTTIKDDAKSFKAAKNIANDFAS